MERLISGRVENGIKQTALYMIPNEHLPHYRISRTELRQLSLSIDIKIRSAGDCISIAHRSSEFTIWYLGMENLPTFATTSSRSDRPLTVYF